MATNELQFLLLGKTGHGKSATGNSLLDNTIFKKSGSTTSETKDVKLGVAEFGSYKLNVVDGPGLEDTDLTPVDDKVSAMNNVEKALALCYGGVDAFLCVFKFGDRFGEEDRSAIEALKHIFGEKFMEHVIVVVTGGDTFEKDMDDAGCDETFDQWWKKQRGQFRQLCNDCDGRVVLINNFEKDKHKGRQQVEQIIKHTCNLRSIHGRYTSEFFQKAERKRSKLILEQKAPILKKEFQEKICLLNIEILKFAADSSNRNKASLKVRIQELRNEIEKHDQGFGVLDELSVQMNTVESCLQDTVKLKEIAEKLEYVRNAKNTWTGFGQDMTKLGAGLAEKSPKTGATFAAVGAAVSVVANVTLTVQEMKLNKEKKKLENESSDAKK